MEAWYQPGKQSSNTLLLFCACTVLFCVCMSVSVQQLNSLSTALVIKRSQLVQCSCRCFCCFLEYVLCMITAGAHIIIHEILPVLLQGTSAALRRICPLLLGVPVWCAGRVCKYSMASLTNQVAVCEAMKMVATGFAFWCVHMSVCVDIPLGDLVVIYERVLPLIFCLFIFFFFLP